VILAIVPVKTLDATKSRLRPALGDATERLTRAMLGDVLGALLEVPALARVVVVTPDADVAAAAREVGAEALTRPDPGLNATIDAAAAEVAATAEALLVVLGDVAGARPDEIGRLLAAAPARGVALAPSRDGGSAALVRVPPDVIPGGFGPGSAKVHRDLAARAGVGFVRVELPSLAIDVDTGEDLGALVRSDAPARRTRALLRELGWSGA
jgi:2-phospho-L-lactate guanylyltransferase